MLVASIGGYGHFSFFSKCITETLKLYTTMLSIQ